MLSDVRLMKRRGEGVRERRARISEREGQKRRSFRGSLLNICMI